MDQQNMPWQIRCTGRLVLWLSLVLAAVTVLLYLPVLNNAFVNFDDPLYVTENDQVGNGFTMAGVRWALTALAASNWHPLTWLSHMLDVQLFGMLPLGHHLSSIILHMVNTVLLFLFLHRTTGASWRSFCVALLFGVHPLHVESVAWIAERKDLLCGLFWLLTLFSYERYVKGRSRSAYVLALGLYAAAVLSKPMAVTLPVILFVTDYWPLQRFGKCTGHGPSTGVTEPVGAKQMIVEKAPFMLIAAISVVVTLMAQSRSGAIKATHIGLEDVVNSCVAYGAYLYKMVWPGHLVVLYPYAAQPLWKAFLAGAMVLGVVAIFWQWRDRRYFLAGWLWYLITLLPVSGIIRIGEHSVADRYTYLPLIGPFIIICWGVGDISGTGRKIKTFLVAAGAGLLLFYSVLTWKQTFVWRDSESLFRHAIQHTDNNWMACHNLGLALLERHETAEGLRWLQESVRINPSYATAYNSLGIAYGRLGFPEKAIEALRVGVRTDPGFVAARYNLVRALIEQGDKAAALAEFQLLRRIDPPLSEQLEVYF